MKVKLSRTREIYGRNYPKGSVIEISPLYGKRLIKIGDATGTNDVSHTELPDVPEREKLIDYGFDTVEKVLKADLTSIPGIGPATQTKIKDAIK